MSYKQQYKRAVLNNRYKTAREVVGNIYRHILQSRFSSYEVTSDRKVDGKTVSVIMKMCITKSA